MALTVTLDFETDHLVLGQRALLTIEAPFLHGRVPSPSKFVQIILLLPQPIPPTARGFDAQPTDVDRPRSPFPTRPWKILENMGPIFYLKADYACNSYIR
ncbi:hypothetical protein TWF569_008649 [Orbilia oligospora]|nr:hypothetical protein TWF569_008649 [Orbilia oligospora]